MPIALRWLLTVLVLGATPHKGLTAMRGALRTFAAATRNAPAVRARQDLPRRGAPRAPRQARSAPRLDAEQPPTREYRGVTDRTKPKRKVCVHLGFIGSNYRGMLFQNDPAIPTVERELLRALRDWGAILPENADQPTKVGWQRASRTDKGVHAIGAAVSCKLLLADEQLEELAVTERVLGGFGGLGLSTSAADTPPAPSPPPPHPGAIGAPAGGTGGAPPGMVTVVNAPQLAALNELLPKDIRIFSIQRTRGGFDSYEDCSARRYVYLLPESALGPGGAEGLSTILRKFTGTKAYHNFASGVRAPPSQADEIASALPEAGPLGWPLAVHPLRPRSEAFRTVLRCEVAKEPIELGDGRGRMYAVEIHGRSFLLHQIRHMIGGALAVAHGLVPEGVFDAALGSPFRVDIAPLAPGEGLALLANEFFNERKKTTDVAMTERARDAMADFMHSKLADHVHLLYTEGAAHGSPSAESSGSVRVGPSPDAPDGDSDDGGSGDEPMDDAPDFEVGGGDVYAGISGRRDAERSLDLPGRRTPFCGWDSWMEVLLSGHWLEKEQANRWDDLRAAVERWEAGVDASRARREQERERRREQTGRAAETAGGDARERARAARALPRGVQTAVAVAFQLLPGPALEGWMARLNAAVDAGEVPPGQNVRVYVEFLLAEAGASGPGDADAEVRARAEAKRDVPPA